MFAGMAERGSHRFDALRTRLEGGDIVVLDGGMGTGLQAKGVPMDGEAWSGVANLTHPDTVRELHMEYLRAGADVIITNTFAAGPGMLAAAGYGDRFAEANRRAVQMAMDARDSARRDQVPIAGSMSRDVAHGLASSEGPAARRTDADALRDAYRRQTSVLVDAGVDLIALEMMGSRIQARAAVAAASASGLPVWLGVSVASAGSGRATTIDGEDLAELVGEVVCDAVDAVLVMHTDLDLVSESLDVIATVFPGRLGAYPHVGDWRPPNWIFRDITPDAFADASAAWVSHGASLVGGCCGIGSAHIAEIARRRRR
jgi:S-methylmethionine-dependent homocysteine/selenocysteine methylase